MASLSRTIEGATQRYLENYEKKFAGSADEMSRLRELAQIYIHRLKNIAPKFYKEKLPRLIDQAASTLLTFDTSTQEGNKRFHETHANLLLVLEDLRSSQPAGPFDFISEVTRLREKSKLLKRFEKLKEEISEAEAADFEAMELGDEGDETEEVTNMYTKVFNDLPLLRAEAKRVALELAFLDGEPLEEEEVHFRLEVGHNSMLNKLSEEQLEILETQLDALYQTQHKKCSAIVVDKSLIDNIFEALNIEEGKYRKVDIHDMQVDALEAYKTFRRKLEQDRSNEYFQSLLEDERLRPKEGIILEGPDDIPHEIQAKLDQNDCSSSRALKKIFEDYGNKTEVDENTGAKDLSESEDSDGTSEIIQLIKEKGAQFARVKEEVPDDDEFEHGRSNNQSMEAVSDSPTLETTREPQEKINQAPDSNQRKDDSDSDDSIICLGTVDPQSKVIVIDID